MTALVIGIGNVGPPKATASVIAAIHRGWCRRIGTGGPIVTFGPNSAAHLVFVVHPLIPGNAGGGTIYYRLWSPADPARGPIYGGREAWLLELSNRLWARFNGKKADRIIQCAVGQWLGLPIRPMLAAENMPSGVMQVITQHRTDPPDWLRPSKEEFAAARESIQQAQAGGKFCPYSGRPSVAVGVLPRR